MLLVPSGAGSSATAVISSGADLTVGDFAIATTTSAVEGSLTITGAGSTLTQTLANVITLGAASGSKGTINVLSAAVLTTGGSGLVVNATGTLNIQGGTVHILGPITRNGTSTFIFISGALDIVDNFTVGTGGLLGTNVTFNSNQQFTTTAKTTINATRTLTLNNTNFSTGALVINGTLAYTGTAASTLGAATGTGTVTKTNTGTLTVTGALGTGGIDVNANGGTTRFTVSETLESLSIGAGAVVTLDSAAPASLEEIAVGELSQTLPLFDEPGIFAGESARLAGDSPQAVPEPGALGLLVLGATLLFTPRRRA